MWSRAWLLPLSFALLGSGCLDDDGRDSTIFTHGVTIGNEGNEETGETEAEAEAPGDGDPSGDGDGDPSGDGDGDPTSGDGDGEPTTGDGDGDGDGDPTGDGDGEPDIACASTGAISHPGSGGPTTANQNCPTTDFYINVANSPGPIADVEVSVDGIAANTSQNRLWLIGPSNTQVLLFDRRGTAFTDDWVGTYFDDESPTPIAAAQGPFHGCYRPETGLSAFAGQQADGPWTLRVETCLYETSITSWSIHLHH
jgi:subtilisin-like proprotein convertase family protein